MRDHLFFFLNGQKTPVSGRDALGMLAPFLRGNRGLTGTKIACAHGACGSCSVLLGRPDENENGFDYQPVNACILPVFACDGAHIVSVEGLNGPDRVGGEDTGVLSPVQRALVECHGAQCGFCTPGMVITLSAFHEQSRPLPATREDVQAALEGNLCRCTGYTPIIDAGLSVETADLRPLNELYPPAPLLDGLKTRASDPVEITVAEDELEGEQKLFAPRTPDEAVRWKAAHPGALVIAGATEIGVAMSVKGFAPREILSLSRVEGLDEVSVDEGTLILGARASWTKVREHAQDVLPEFADLLSRWGSPQLRNAGTIAGSIVRASAISDSLPFLLVCEAELELVGESGSRRLSVAQFLDEGAALLPDELLVRVRVPLPDSGQTLRLFKVSKRRAFDRSLVSAAFLLTKREGRIEDIRIAFGGVAPLVLRLTHLEEWLRDKPLGAATWREAGAIAQEEIAPASDAGASREYRTQLVSNLLRKFGAQF
jgi:xanthine dehydrogenase small subunit